MAVDILDLAEFYNQPLGQLVTRRLRAAIAAHWPSPDTQEALLGYGFAPPLARALWDKADWRFLMPAQQGVMVETTSAHQQAALIDEQYWPLRDQSMNRIVMVHGLEAANRHDAVLAESWRVLVPGGRLMLVVPNRAGLWARRDRTPFGQGRPYSRSQLRRQLKQAGFSVMRQQPALMLPPFLPVRLLDGLTPLERALAVMLPQMGGLWLVEAVKQVPAPARRARRQAALAGGFVRPAFSPQRGHLRDG